MSSDLKNLQYVQYTPALFPDFYNKFCIQLYSNILILQSFYTDEDLNPHTHQRWVHVLIYLSATLSLKYINSPPKAGEFKYSMMYSFHIDTCPLVFMLFDNSIYRKKRR